MITNTIGIDPGQSGAIAALRYGAVLMLEDMPTTPRLHGKGQQVDGAALASMLMEVRSEHGPCQVLLEAVASRPGQGVSSMFRFGESVGVVLGVCGALQIPVRWVSPQRWKKAAGLSGKDKDAARTLAIQMHPEISDKLTRKKDVGRADAILIAEFGGSHGNG